MGNKTPLKTPKVHTTRTRVRIKSLKNIREAKKNERYVTQNPKICDNQVGLHALTT
jgi:hypothetical protein